MNKPQVISAKFVKGVTDPESFESEYPEVAIIGRSNVGKSSLINRLTNQSKLARVSKTPGRTKEVNVFEVNIRNSQSEIIKINLMDLPGFGYAKVSKVERDQLARLIYAYLIKSKAPQFIFILNDSKRLPAEDEIAVRNLCADNEINHAIILTKCDRLSRKELSENSKNIAEAYGLEASDLLYAAKDLSVGSIWERCLEFV
jgi:GTP-binding protein